MKGKGVGRVRLSAQIAGNIMARKPLAVAVTGVLAAMASTWVQAQNTDDPVQLETIKVVAPGQASLTVPSLPEVKATMRQVPGGANVIDSESYATGRASTLQDALGRGCSFSLVLVLRKHVCRYAVPVSSALSICAVSNCCRMAPG